MSFKEISNFKIFVQTLITTLIIWASIYFTFYLIISSMGFHISALHVILLSLTAMMSRLIQGVANLGSHEAGWYGALIIIGFTQKDASVVAVSSHIVILGYMLIITLFAKLTLKMETER